MLKRLPLVCLGVALLVAACAAPTPQAAPPVAQAPAAPAAALAGTSWRLAEIQSMDDAQGTTRPDDPALYTVAFGEDGRAVFRLNCNRASGGYTVEPQPDGASGALTFAPLAMTKAMCPPPSLDTRIARDMEFVRSYVLRDNKLYMSLMADGGIYAWTPAPAE
jgi:heat shock protein HslJ